MGFVKRCYQLEEFLDEQGCKWSSLRDSDYRSLIQSWKSTFESLMMGGYYQAKGDMAISSLREMLGSGVYIFNVPNYKYLPVTPSQHDPTYGYYVENISSINRNLFNQIEAVVCDKEMEFMCVFNHEGQALVPEFFYEKE